MMLNVDCFPLGYLDTNCYIISKGNRAILIDPSWDELFLFYQLKDKTLEAILLTHAHWDHIGALEALHLKLPEVPIYIHPEEEKYLLQPEYNLSSLGPKPFTFKGPTHKIQHNEKLNFLEEDILCVHTPGHSEGSLSYYFSSQGILFSGDTLFYSAIGRTDFLGSDYNQLQTTLKEIIFSFPDETLVYPGHGRSTYIKDERKKNTFE